MNLNGLHSALHASTCTYMHAGVCFAHDFNLY